MGTVEVEVGALGPDLLADPCAFLLAEHGRHRALLGHLDRLARRPHGPARSAVARALAAWLACELPLHLADEAESLMPRLAEAVPALTHRLAAEDASLDAQRQALREALAPVALCQPAGAEFAATALAFAAQYRQRLALEEAEVLPIARRVLDASRCQSIAAEMRRRRS